MTLMYLLHQPFVKGAIGGAIAALKLDYDVYKRFKDEHPDATWDWTISAYRVLVSALVAGGTSAGLTSI